MGQTLTNGIYLPDEGERNSYSGLEANWRTLDALILTINGKAAPNVANTWTAAQTFTAGIAGDLTGNVTGNLTGTASKAISDEDGTSIKTGYVNVAGNQTVTGQKTWSGENSFSSNANFGSNVMITGDRLRLYDKNDQVDVTPSSSITKSIYFTDKNSTAIAYFSFQHRSTSSEPFRTCWRQQKLDGTNNYHSIDFNNLGQFYPETAGVSLGSSFYQWSAVYAQTYFYKGTAWGLDKVNEWSNTNRFLTSIALKNTTLEKGVAPSSNGYRIVYFTDKNNSDLSTITARTNTTGESYIALRAENLYKNGVMDSTGSLAYSALYIGLTPDGKSYCVPRADVYPEYNNYYDLGTSTNKWKTLNGINPGALSLPSRNYVEIDTTNWDLTGADNSYTPPADGYIFCGSSTGTDVKIFDFTTTLGSTSHSSTVKPNYVYLPVRKNDNCIVGFIGSAPPIVRFYPCLGNV